MESVASKNCHPEAQIDNIFINIICLKSSSCNLKVTISDELPQFLLVPNVFCKPPTKSPIFTSKIGLTLVKEILFLIIFSLIRVKYWKLRNIIQNRTLDILITLFEYLKIIIAQISYLSNLQAVRKQLTSSALSTLIKLVVYSVFIIKSSFFGITIQV